MPFILNGTEDYETAHESFLLDMFKNGWSYGDEDLSSRKHPDLVSWTKLPLKNREMIAFTGALVTSAQSFYEDLVADLEEQLMDSFTSLVIKGKPLMTVSAAFTGITH